MPDTYTENDNGSYSVVSDDELRFITLSNVNPLTGLPWGNVNEVKALVASTPNLWSTYSSLPSQEEQDAMAAAANRDTRNQLLSDSDWTQIPDSPVINEVKAAWVIYRTALRNLTAHENWPNLEADDWPTKP
jgi:hypothetical protein